MSSEHAKVEAGRAQDLSETRVDLGMKMRKKNELRAKVGKLEKVVATVCDALKVKDEKIQELGLEEASDLKAIAHLEKLVKHHHSNCLCVTDENSKFLKRVIDLDEKLAMQCVCGAISAYCQICDWKIRCFSGEGRGARPGG